MELAIESARRPITPPSSDKQVALVRLEVLSDDISSGLSDDLLRTIQHKDIGTSNSMGRALHFRIQTLLR